MPSAAATAEEPSTATTRRRRSTSRSATSTATAMAEATPEPTTAMAAAPAAMEEAPAEEEASAMSSGMDSMEDLLSRALGGNEPTMEATMEAAPTPMEANLPDVPSRAAVTRALGGLMPRMRRCAGDQVGIATARIRVGNDGQVRSVNIGGRPFGGTPQGACMEGVVRTARFPRFQRTHFDVTYPFSIRPLN